ncbi:hypothetical protein J7T55_010172 [Diaporthe amygdali]|uniref:uncharacterized protein n=1 Tax=Phomopsis amygdali TaxID=1214568 RepID=UPI0022FF1E71|nr:uncharacterized protein J7T55_010172 [Diaporthe amygdali]KAJ0113928.1 hypothetical protein J7T55_010172 [Diaporthe amygdali]
MRLCPPRKTGAKRQFGNNKRHKIDLVGAAVSVKPHILTRVPNKTQRNVHCQLSNSKPQRVSFPDKANLIPYQIASTQATQISVPDHKRLADNRVASLPTCDFSPIPAYGRA